MNGAMNGAAFTPREACDTLAALGVHVRPEEVRLEPRDRGWLAWLPGERLAWFAGSAAARAALATERRVLAVAPDGGCEVRTVVPGTCDPLGLYARVRDDPGAAARFGASVGAALGELHAAVPAADVAGWLPRRPDWPEPLAWVQERLPRVVPAVDDPELHARAYEVLARYEALDTSNAERVLAHGDLGFHNLAVEPATLAVRGVFDWEAAYWGDPCHDFRYLVCNGDCPPLLDAALAAYERRTGRGLSRDRIALENAACAVTYLAFRAGVLPEARWCSRTLAEDLAWTRRALARVLDGAA